MREIEIAMKQMSFNKSSGGDGLTLELYKMFKDVLQESMLDVYRKVENQSKLSPSIKLGNISILL